MATLINLDIDYYSKCEHPRLENVLKIMTAEDALQKEEKIRRLINVSNKIFAFIQQGERNTR